MAYSKRVPQIKLVLNREEYNNLIEILTKNLEANDEDTKSIASMTKDKLLKYSLPREEDDKIEIDIRLYINETVDIIAQLLSYVNGKVNKIDYYQVLLKVRENFEVEDQ